MLRWSRSLDGCLLVGGSLRGEGLRRWRDLGLGIGIGCGGSRWFLRRRFVCGLLSLGGCPRGSPEEGVVGLQRPCLMSVGCQADWWVALWPRA